MQCIDWIEFSRFTGWIYTKNQTNSHGKGKGHYRKIKRTTLLKEFIYGKEDTPDSWNILFLI